MNWYNNLFGGAQGIVNNSQAQQGNVQGLTSGQALQQMQAAANMNAQQMQNSYQNLINQQGQMISGALSSYIINPIRCETVQFTGLTKIKIKVNEYNLISMLEFQE